MRSAWMVLLVGACSGGSGGGLGHAAITAEEAQPLCMESCQHDIDCGSGNDLASCTTSCVDDFVPWARGDAVKAIIDCRVALACTENDDHCLLLVEPLEIHHQWEDACRANFATCVQSPG